MTNGWQTVPLADVLKQDTSYVTELESIMYPKLSVKLYGKGAVLDAPTDGANIKMQRHQFAKSGQIILSEIWAKKGAIGIVPKEGEGALVTSHFFLFDVIETKVLREYVGLLLKRNYFANALDTHARGTTGYAAIRPKQFLSLEIPLPPLDEQRRIVQRVEALAARIAKAQLLREESNKEIKSMIYSARNEIVENLRKKYDDVKLNDVCVKITDGPHVSPRYTPDGIPGIPFISVRNISETGLDFSTAKYVSPEDHKIYSKKAKVERGDILYTKGGTTGVARRVDTDQEFSIWVHVALLKLNREIAIDGFIEHMLNSPTCKTQALQYTHGSSNKDLGISRMANIVFPLPPLDEQRRIVGYLDSVQARLASLRELQSTTGKELSALLPSVLDRHSWKSCEKDNLVILLLIGQDRYATQQ